MVDFVFNSGPQKKLGTCKKNNVWDFCEPDSDANLSQYKNMRGPRAHSRWGAKLTIKTGVLGGWSPPNITKITESISKVKYKIDHMWKTKHRIKKNSWTENFVSEHCASYLLFFFTKMDKLYDYIWKYKNRKIDSSFVSEHCASFWTKK